MHTHPIAFGSLYNCYIAGLHNSNQRSLHVMIKKLKVELLCHSVWHS